MFKLFAVVLASLALLVAVVPAAHAEPTSTVLSGTVRTFLGAPATYVNVCAVNLADQETWCVFTNDAGAYEFAPDPSWASVKLYATSNGLPQTYYGSSGSTNDPASATAITLGESAAIGDLDITFTAATGVTGSVTLSDAGATEIRISACSGWDDYDSWDCSSISVLSPAASAFSLDGLDAGRYRVEFWAAGYGSVYVTADVAQHELTALDPVTLTKLDPGSMSGTVVGTDGNPIAGVLVTATAQGAADLDTTTDASGAYSFTNMPSGVWWYLNFSKAGYAPADDGASLDPGQAVAIGTTHLAAAASVSVHVQDTAAQSVSDAELRLCSGDDGDENCVWGSGTSGGDYTFIGVSPGSYVLHASHNDYLEGFYPGVRSIAEAAPIRVDEGGTINLTTPLTLVRPASLSGAVTFASDGAAVNAEVGLYDSSGAEISRDYMYSGGTYQFESLWPGSYTVKVASWDGFQTTWLGGATTFADASRITISEAESATDANVVVAGDVVLTGTVTEDGAAVGGALVRFFPVDDEATEHNAETDANGAYSLRLPAGSYDVGIRVGDVEVCESDNATQCITEPVAVSASNHVLNLALPAQSGTVSGAIAASATLSHFWMDLLDASHSYLGGMYWDTDTEGAMPTSYSFARVPYGSYTLVVSSRFTGQDYATVKEIPITVGAASVVHDLTLAPAARTITGTVSVSQPESWVTVKAINTETGFMQATTSEDVAVGPSTYSLAVEPGTYKLFVSTPEIEEWYPAASTMADAQSVTVAADSDLTDIDFTLPQTSFTVTGKLVLPEGVTAAQAQQNLTVWFADPGVTSENSDADTYSATLDDSGNYSVTLPAGSYRPHVEASTELGTIAAAGDAFFVATDQVGPDISVARGGSLTGRVLATDGISVAGAEVTVTGADGTSNETYADGLGYWHMDGVSAGTATVKALATGYVSGAANPSPTVIVGDNTTVAAITLAKAGRLYVDIPEANIGGVTVVVTDTSGHILRERSVYSGDGPTVIDNVPVGTVKVRFEDEEIVTEWWQDKTTLATATPVTLSDTTGVTLVPTLAEPTSGPIETGTLSGTVTNTAGVSGHLSVLATSTTTGRSYQADAGSEGGYEIVAPADTYTVKATLCTGFWIASDHPQTNSDIGYCDGGSRSITQQDAVLVTADHSTSGIDFSFDVEEFTLSPTPTITGASEGGAKVGDELTAHTSGWSPSPDQFTYQWLRDGENITDATTDTYTLTDADRAAEISVKVTAIRAGYTSVTKTSAVLPGPAGATFTTTPTPTITGDAKLDATLTADAGTWAPVADKLVYTWFADSTQIAQGEDLTTYTLTTDEVGKAVTVKVTASKAGYESVTKESSATAAVTADTMEYTKPTITGTPTFGQELTATAGTWTDGAALTYQWYRGADTIQGATQSTYTLGADDVGKAITVAVTGTKSGYLSHTETSLATDAVAALPMTSVKPQITGVAKVGVKLTATVTGWSPSGADLSYTWSANGAVIAGATASTFTPTDAQLGKTITVTVTATKPGYQQTSATSDQTAAVVTDKITGSTPRISGTVKVGYRLTATAGSWTPVGVALSYQWYASGVAVSGATGPTLLLTPAQLGKAMSVTVTGSASGYTAVSKPSARTAAVAAGTLSAKTPVISGKVKVGKTLKATPGTWGPSPVTLRYQWYANGKKISKATKSSYKIAKAYKGKKITVKVTGSKAGYTTVTKTSKATAKVK